MGPGSEVGPGASIAVYWELDRKWYNAEVLHYDPMTGISKLLYSDGEREELDLTGVKCKPLWSGQLRDRVGKVGGEISNKLSIHRIVKTLLDVEDRLPPKGVHTIKKTWWAAWNSRVTSAGKSGNIIELAKASVDIALQMKDNISSSWWKSQRIKWQKQVQSCTTSDALSSHLTDLLTKAVDWNAARNFFSDHSESGREQSIVEGGRDAGSMDHAGPDIKGASGSSLSARDQRMEMKRRDSKNCMQVEEDSEVKKSTSKTAHHTVRRSKRKRNGDDELSRVDSPRTDTPDVNPTVAENKSPIAKRRKGGKADEARDLVQRKLDNAQSETDINEDHTRVEEIRIKENGRKGKLTASTKHEEGAKAGQGSETDPKTNIGQPGVRKSSRILRSDRAEAGQSPETTAFEKKNAHASNKSILEVANSTDRQEREESSEPKERTRSTLGPSLRTRSSAGKESESGNEESGKVSRERKERGIVKESTQGLEQVPNAQIDRQRARPRRTRNCQPEKDNDREDKEKARSRAESPGISDSKNFGLSPQDPKVVRWKATVTPVETRLRKPGRTKEGIVASSGDPVDETITQPQNGDAADESTNPTEHPFVSTEESNAVPRDEILTRVENKSQKAGDTGDGIGSPNDPVNQVERMIENSRKCVAADESINTEDDRVGVSAQNSNVVQREEIVACVERRPQKAGHIEDENGRSSDLLGRGRRRIKKPHIFDAGENTPKRHKVQGEGRRERIETRGDLKAINISIESDDVRGGKEDGNNSADKDNFSLSHEASEPVEREDPAERRASMNDSSVEVRQTRGPRVTWKVSEAKVKVEDQDFDPFLLVEAERRLSALKQVMKHSLGIALTDGSEKLANETDGDEEAPVLQGINPADVAVDLKSLSQQRKISEKMDSDVEDCRKRDPPGNATSVKQETESKQMSSTALMTWSGRMRVRSGGARIKAVDEQETKASSGDKQLVRATRSSAERNSRTTLRLQTFDGTYEETTSGSGSQDESDEYKLDDKEVDDEEEEEEDEEEHVEKTPAVVTLDDSWGERLPTDDSEVEDDAPTQSELKEPEELKAAQAADSLEHPVTREDWIVVDEKCSVCDFAGADELMLLCDQDGCSCALHTFCITPPLKAIPEGEWFCPECTRIRENPSGTRRPPKTSSSVNYPAKLLGSIIGRRRESSQEEGKTKLQYLVKWDSLSHEHDSWVPEDWLLFMHNRLVTNFQRKYPVLSESHVDVDERRPEWLQVDRIIACRKQGGKGPLKPSQVLALRLSQDDGTGIEFLVKWRSLDHLDATWEQERKTDEFQQAVASYMKRHERAEEPGSEDEEAKTALAIQKQPDYVCGGMMYSFQLHGLKWLLSNFEQRRSVILADEMGLGKTIQALAFIACVRHEKLSNRPALVIGPKSTLPGWEQEFRCWAPSLNVVVYQGDKENRAFIRDHEFHSASKRPLFDVLLTSYELAAFDNSLLSRFRWASLIVDEGHRVKNIRSKLGTLLKRHKADFRLLLTGTPVQNTLTELFALLHFLDPQEFPDPEASAREFTDVDIRAKNSQSDSKVIEQQVSRLHELLNPRMLRRLKTEVLRDMIPGKKVVEVPCALTPLQRHLYVAILKKNFKVLNKGVKSGMKRSLHMILTDLKMVCNHPYIFPDKEPQQLDPSKTYKMLIAASGKLQLLEKLLPLLKEQGHRVLLFSQMTKMLDILEDFLNFLGLSYSRIDGSCSAASRQTSIAEFNAANSSTFIFLISTRAGGLGINLPSADTVIIYDPDFNPFVDLQAQARAHRIGQDKIVLVYQLITKCSVEEKILERSRKKLAMENLVMSKESKENAADINTLLLHGAQKVLDEHDIEATSVKLTDESVKKLLDREFLTSTPNADDPTSHGYLGAVQGADFSSPTVNEQEIQASKGGEGNEWQELLQVLVEQDAQEELGRGKRVRKQVDYAVEGHAEGHEDDEYDPSSNDGVSSSESDLSVDCGGVKSKAVPAHKKTDHVVGDMPSVDYPGGISTPTSSIVHNAGSTGLEGPNGPFPPSPMSMHARRLHASMQLARGNYLHSMGYPADMVHLFPSQGHASFGTVDSSAHTLSREPSSNEGPGSTSMASIPFTSRSGTLPILGHMPTKRTMVRDQSGRVPTEPVALPSTAFSSGAGLDDRIDVSSSAPFPGVHSYTNNVSICRTPSFPGVPVPSYTPHKVRSLPSHPLPFQVPLIDGRVDPQNLTIGNPASATFSNLQRASPSWKRPVLEQTSTRAVSGNSWSSGGGCIPGQQQDPFGSRQLPIASSSNFQNPPSSEPSGSAAVRQPFLNQEQHNRGRDSSHLSSTGAAPWLGGYVAANNPLTLRVDPRSISPSLATSHIPVHAVPLMPEVLRGDPRLMSPSLATPHIPVHAVSLMPDVLRVNPRVVSPSPVHAVPVMPGGPYVPALCPAFELHDPTVLQVPPTPDMSAPGKVPEPYAGRASTVHFAQPAVSSRGTVAGSYPRVPMSSSPHLNFVQPVPPLDRNVSPCDVAPANAAFMTVPYVGTADAKSSSLSLPMPQTPQAQSWGRSFQVSGNGTATELVDTLGWSQTGQPVVSAAWKQTKIEMCSNNPSTGEQ